MTTKRNRLSNPLLYWAVERETIRKKKEAGEPPPWTTDPILRTYNFTNLRRRDDRVSRWLIENVLIRMEDFDDLDTFMTWSALCRWVNWPPMLELIIDNAVTHVGIDLGKAGQRIDDCVAIGEKAWTGAYMIRPAKPPYAHLRKGMFVATIVVGQEFVKVLPAIKAAISRNSIQATCEALQAAKFWGPFMAGQVVADWAYTPLLANAADLYTWAPQGPGSRRGYNRILGRPLTASIPTDEWLCNLIGWREEIIAALGAEYNDLTLGDCQNALCECDKMLRVKYGEGRPKAKYDYGPWYNFGGRLDGV